MSIRVFCVIFPVRWFPLFHSSPSKPRHLLLHGKYSPPHTFRRFVCPEAASRRGAAGQARGHGPSLRVHLPGVGLLYGHPTAPGHGFCLRGELGKNFQLGRVDILWHQVMDVIFYESLIRTWYCVEYRHPTAPGMDFVVWGELGKDLQVSGATIPPHKVMDFVFEECLLRTCNRVERKFHGTRSWTSSSIRVR